MSEEQALQAEMLKIINQMDTKESFMENLGGELERCDDGMWVHYPFQLVGWDKKGSVSLASLDVQNNSEACYKIMSRFVKEEKCTKVFMSMDFPALEDIENDFVAIISYEDGKFDICAIPYNNETGEKYPVVPLKESLGLAQIMSQFNLIYNYY